MFTGTVTLHRVFLKSDPQYKFYIRDAYNLNEVVDYISKTDQGQSTWLKDGKIGLAEETSLPDMEVMLKNLKPGEKLLQYRPKGKTSQHPPKGVQLTLEELRELNLRWMFIVRSTEGGFSRR